MGPAVIISARVTTYFTLVTKLPVTRLQAAIVDPSTYLLTVIPDRTVKLHAAYLPSLPSSLHHIILIYLAHFPRCIPHTSPLPLNFESLYTAERAASHFNCNNVHHCVLKAREDQFDVKKI